MVKLTYTPTLLDLETSLVQLLKQIWNFNTHTDKHECVDCLVFENWCISYARTKWEPDFVNFEIAIRKIKETDRTFINLTKLVFLNLKKFLIFLEINNFF